MFIWVQPSLPIFDSRILSSFVFFTVLKHMLSLKTNLFFNSVSILLQNYGNFAT
ncbi:hypothetical protein LEP1GSC059_3072 [Leptospira noguchii serovar Panama str. CZ214]|uniref:Uncharacterized protein n=1 Tax=Leptospira noguchii serovar Panama str. CZ214 TaxID=1001595 RepID=T0FLI8_9LEPT|nr:hypothetical protein LEP1GSC059_3072 [Leptospira noguchii serovar Panama str. CZ214]